MITAIERLNKKARAKSISTFDFSTLYSKIPHDKLISVLDEIVDFCFRGCSNSLLSVSKSGARWVTKPSKNSLSFNIESVKLTIKFLMDNCLFSCGDCVYRQIIGLPMGSDPAPFMANLFLYHYESSWLKNIKKNDIHTARKFSNTFRFIDDLNAINDSGKFEEHFKEIYPPELELKKEHGNNSASFLDLDIEIDNKRFKTKLFDKLIKIVRMPDKSSNMPSKIFSSCIGAETLRIARISSTLHSFQESCHSLYKRMLAQGASKAGICRVLKKVYGRHPFLVKFGVNSKVFCDNLLNF